MTITYRAEKGSPLSADELDENFRDLDQRLKDIEKKQVRTIDKIIQKDKLILIQDQTGVDIGQVRLPIISLNPRGDWKKGEEYIVNDLVIYKDVMYICRQSSKSDSFNLDIWQVFLKSNKTTVLKVHQGSELPMEAKAGAIAFLKLDDGQIKPVFCDSKAWRYLHNFEVFKEL